VDENARVCRFTGAKVVKQTPYSSDPRLKHQVFPGGARFFIDRIAPVAAG
jgi:hypothetical protein